MLLSSKNNRPISINHIIKVTRRVANSRFTESSGLVVFSSSVVGSEIQRANYLQTLAFPAYFSVLKKGRARQVPLPYSVKCKQQHILADLCSAS